MQLSRLGKTIVKNFSPANLIPTFPRRAGRVVTIMALVVLGTTMLGRAQEPAQPSQAAEPQQSAAELQKLVAPIALYPDSLVAQVLAASTYPTQIVEAQRWLQAHSNLQGEELGRAVDQQSWDPSVKALVQFPAVLANMDKNLSWTTALGDAYYNQQQDVLDAVQVMRQRAEGAGNLRTTSQQRVIRQEREIIIEPVDPDYCYLPIYDPWIVYGPRIVPYPGYYYDPWYGPAFVSWGPRIRLGFFFGFGWGWRSWGCNWHSHFVVFNHNRYFSRSGSFGHFAGGNRFGRSDNRGGNRFDNRSTGNNRGARLGASDHNRGATISNRTGDRARTVNGRSTGGQNNRGGNGYESRGGVRSGGYSNGRQMERGSVVSRGRETYSGGGRSSGGNSSGARSSGGGRSSGGSGRSSGSGGGGRSSGSSGGHSSGGGGSRGGGGGGRHR